MRRRTGAALAALLAVLLGVAGAVVIGGESTGVAVLWVSDTGTDIGANHHPVAAGRVAGAGMVYAPVSGEADTRQCRLAALWAENGSTRWRHTVPPDNCTIHSVADPAIVDSDGDGAREVLAASTTEALLAFDPATGAVERSYRLSAYGYTRPHVANFLREDEAPEIAVVDVRGVAFVFEPDGSLAWRRDLNGTTYAPPQVADFTGDGTVELAVGLGTSDVTLLDGDGSVVWHRRAFGESVGWATSGQADGDPGAELVLATTGGTVAVVDGATGETQWRRDLGRLAAVRAFGDGDGDGDPEVYAVAADATLRAFDAASGEREWSTTLVAGGGQMTPPPSLGDLDGDGDLELVAVTNDGLVTVVDPTDGAILASYSREPAIFTHPTLADVDGDGDAEAFVMYGDGRVVALDARSDA